MAGRVMRTGAIALLWLLAGTVVVLQATLQYTSFGASPRTVSGLQTRRSRSEQSEGRNPQVSTNAGYGGDNRFGQYQGVSPANKGAVTGGALAAGLLAGISASPNLPILPVLLVAATAIGLLGRDAFSKGFRFSLGGSVPQGAGILIVLGLGLVLATSQSSGLGLVIAVITAAGAAATAVNSNGPGGFTGAYTLPRNSASAGNQSKYSAPASRPNWFPRAGSNVSSLYSSGPNWQPGSRIVNNWQAGQWFSRGQ